MPYVCAEADPTIPSLDRDVLDIMAVLANVVQAGKRILQLGANRAQCLVAFQDYLFKEHGPEGPTHTLRMHSPSELSTPIPIRVHWDKAAGVQLNFTWEELVEAWGSEVGDVDDLAAYWLDSVPLTMSHGLTLSLPEWQLVHGRRRTASGHSL